MRQAILCLLFALLVSCTPAPQSEIFHAFGTTVTVELEGVSAQQSQILFKAIHEQLQVMHHAWHAWQESDLSAIQSACQTGQSIKVDDELVYLITQGKILETQSQGYFNPAIGELIDLWGFLSHTSTQSRVSPTAAAIAKQLAYKPSMNDLIVNNNILHCTNPHVRLDFGAFAKGYGLGKIMSYLQSQGITGAMINGGGDVMILQPSDAAPKRIGIQAPEHDQHTGWILSINESTTVFTSGVYARKFTDKQTQKTYHHLINPKTGYPSKDFISVTVVHPDPMRADAAATALLASNKDSWPAIVEGMSIDKYLLIPSEGETIVSLPMRAILGTTRE